MTCDVRHILFYLCVFVATCSGIKEVQDARPKVEALYPRGFRVTLEDDGYSFFGFRGTVNMKFAGKGEIKQDLVEPKGGKWVYKNRNVQLEIGDTIFYWIYVIKNGKGEMITDLEYTVNEFVREDGTPIHRQLDANLPRKLPATLAPPPPLPPYLLKGYVRPGDDPPPGVCAQSQTVVQGENSICQGTLIFSEEFDKTILKALRNWNAETKFPGEPDFPFNLYIPDDTITFEDGNLVITPVLTESKYREGFVHETLDLNVRCTGKVHTEECEQEASGGQILPPVITAKITTRQSFNFMFGRVEVRAKLPSGSWVMPEINLEPTDYKYGVESYESGLMHVAFARGNPSMAKRLYGGPVLSDMEPFRSLLLREKIGIQNWYNDYHNYTLVWRPDGIDLLVDGQQYGIINPGEGFYKSAKENKVDRAMEWLTGTVMAPLDQLFHITLGVRVGGINDFADDLEGKPWKNGGSKAMLDFWNNRNSWHPSWYNGAMKVDFVRVYAL